MVEEARLDEVGSGLAPFAEGWFVVLAGECLVIVEADERRLRAWDFVHCPPNTPHVFVSAGTEPCALLMVGRRNPDREIVYPVDEAARRYAARVENEAATAVEAYAPFGHWQAERSRTVSDMMGRR